MTRVDFYLLGNADHSRAHVACRLAEKAWRLGNRVFLLTPDSTTAQALDDMLWTFSQGSFVPHALCLSDTDTETHPVLIGHSEPPPAMQDVLISLAPEVPVWFSRFARVADIVGAEEEDKVRGRERFRFYRDRGYPLEAHKL